jgi:hypothetical protein
MKSAEEVQWEAEERRRVAYHEAGHAVMAYTVGRRNGVVSIRPGEHYNGIAFHGPAPRPSELERGKLGLPVPLLPARLRRWIETEILIVVAGREAEFFRFIPPTRYSGPDPDEEAAVRLARASVELSTRESEALAAADHAELPVDERQAEKLAWVAVGPDAEGWAYLNWLRATTRNLVGESGFFRLVEALVPELLRHEVLGGRSVRRILDGARQRRYGSGGRVRPGEALSEMAAAADRIERESETR